MERWARHKYQPNLPLGDAHTYITACPEHLELSRKAAAEGMVLLKNDHNFLPLKQGSRVALFGKATFDYVQGGGGSGEVHSAYRRNLYEGLSRKGEALQIFEPLSDFYRENVRSQMEAGALPGLTREPAVPEDLLVQAADFTDTAIIALCRFSGEGWDRSPVSFQSLDPGADAQSAIQAGIFEDGDFYLSHGERAMIEAVRSRFPHIVLVLNIGGIMDTSWFRCDPQIHSALLTWSAGQEGGLATADILLGEVNPSGRLADTLAGQLEDYPFTADFHESIDYVNYTEDIYVGYRFFETIPGMAQRVVYPFGYGLSYTTFTRQMICSEVLGTDPASQTIRMTIAVTNTGARAGREVVQLYCSAPTGILGKPARQLAAFGKTGLLDPGKTEKLLLEFSTASLASYDDMGKVAKSAWVLEAGTYRFYLGGDVRSAVLLDFDYTLPNFVITEQLSEKLKPSKLPRRLLSDGTYEVLPTGEYAPDGEHFLPDLDPREIDGLPPVFRSHHGYHPTHEVKEGAPDFRKVADGLQTLDEFMDQLTISEMIGMLGGQPNTGVGITFGFGNMPEYGIPNIMTCDGPAGVRIFPEMGVRTTCWPCATLLACTWDRDLVRSIGAAGALEVKENNMGVWLTPAINIHRTPLCGRNFEYYSEDPLITGVLAAAMVEGIQSRRIGACVKHFAFNNKETNRKHSDSRVSERAAREIYLKAFEIIVKTAHPWSIMTSYNKVNGVHTNQRHDLLEEILRGELGFDGMVTTDWWAMSEHWPEILAGNDLKMALGYPDRVQAAVDRGLVTEADIRHCLRHILQLILRLE